MSHQGACSTFDHRGASSEAEIIPIEPEAGNAAAGIKEAFPCYIMKVYINDNPVDASDGQTLNHLIDQQAISQKGIAVAVNSAVIPFKEWQEFTLTEGDKILIITATQGG